MYKPRTRGAKEKIQSLINDGRANFVAPADYQNGSEIDRIVKALIDKVAFDEHVNSLKP